MRGPLFAARLALHALAGGGEAARVAAVEVELARAALAVEDLAGAPRGRRAPARLELVDVAVVVRASAPAWRALAARHGAGLALALPASPARVRGDRLRLAQACANLVANAAEHGGGLVRVEVRSGAGRVRVEVRDDGPGLPAPLAALEAAARGRRSRRGHGLAVAAALARAHGGRLAGAPSRGGARVHPRAAGGRRGGAGVGRGRGGAGGQRPARERAAPRPPPPHCRRPGGVTRRRRAALLLGLALLLGALAASDVARREAALRAQLGPDVDVVVARRPLAAGAMLRLTDLSLRRMPARYAPADGTAFPGALAGHRLAVPVAAGGALSSRAARHRPRAQRATRAARRAGGRGGGHRRSPGGGAGRASRRARDA